MRAHHLALQFLRQQRNQQVASRQPWAVARQWQAAACHSETPDASIPSTSGRSWEQASANAVPYSSTPLLDDRLLLRDFIQNSLYHPTKGYFNRPKSVVGRLETPIDHWKVYCAEEWRMLINKKYKELETSFLTPAELFSPWYGYILARHMLEHRKHTLGLEGLPLHIIEVGGGTGTLARDMLDWIKNNRPDVYASTNYTCLEISSQLAAQQYESVVVKGGHGGRFRVSRGNAWDPGAWGGGPVWDHTYVLMMEVLDNLPHDRVFRRSARHPWQQTCVVALAEAPSAVGQQPGHAQNDKRLFHLQDAGGAAATPSRVTKTQTKRACMETGPWREELEPLDDELIMRALQASYVPTTFEERLDKRLNRLLDFLLAREGEPDVPEGELFFLPTAALALLDVLHHVRPNHSLIATDFDRLPDVRIPGRNAPLVAEKVGGRNIDHSTILVPWGTSDIFFPTDFDALARMYKASAEEAWGEGTGTISTAHYIQGEVMKRYREMERTATICSFNPMIDDFRNARFFFGDSIDRSPADAEAYQVKKKSRAASFAGNQGARSGDRQGSQQHMAGKKGAVVDWEGASGDKRLPWTDTSGSQQERRDGRPQVFVPSNLPEWAQRRLQEQQQQEEQSQRPVAESDRQKKQ